MGQINKSDTYRRILQQVVEKQASIPRRQDQVELVPINDTTHDNYLFM